MNLLFTGLPAWDVLDYVLDPAFQDLAEAVDHPGGDALVVPQAGNRVRAEMISLPERVGGDLFFLHRFP